MRVIDGQTLLIAYFLLLYTVMPSLNKISYLILSYLIACQSEKEEVNQQKVRDLIFTKQIIG